MSETCLYCGSNPEHGEGCPTCLDLENPEGEELAIMEEQAKVRAQSRGWLTGDINQTDSWFR